MDDADRGRAGRVRQGRAGHQGHAPRAGAVVGALALVAACGAARQTPREPNQRALYKDLEREVTVAAATGWSIDGLEVEGLVEAALDSACRVDVLDRRSLAQWLDAEINRLGGPVEQAWRERGKQLSAVEDLLVVTRIRMLLARAEERSLDCPFWLEPEHPFRGRQISESTWQLSASGGGKGTLSVQGDRTDLIFGGAGRLLLGRTTATGDAIYVGVELGASASFPKDDSGERTALELGIDVVTPLVYRRMMTNAYLEGEVGWLGRSSEDAWTDIDNGVHVGVSIGARALRTRFVFPGAAFGVAWERTFVDGADATTLKIGARFVFDLDL